MPTVFREDGFRFFIYSDDHEPAHVHAFKGGAEIRVAIGDETTPSRVMSRRQMSDQDAIRAVRLVVKHQANLVGAWRKIHG